MDYSEKPKVSGNAIVVTLAVLLFGCIIVGALLFPRISQMFQGTAASTPPAADATVAPPANSIAIEISSSNTKEDWMNAVVAQFNAEQHKVASGDVIFVTVKHVTSGGSQKAILDGASKPVVWSPGDQSWVDEANRVWRDRNGVLLIPEACTQTVLAPTGFAMWRPMAEALGWPPSNWARLPARV